MKFRRKGVSAHRRCSCAGADSADIGWLTAAGTLRPRDLYAAYLASRHGEMYRNIGVRPLINAAGTYTTLTGSVMAEETVTRWRRRQTVSCR